MRERTHLVLNEFLSSVYDRKHAVLVALCNIASFEPPVGSNRCCSGRWVVEVSLVVSIAASREVKAGLQ